MFFLVSSFAQQTEIDNSVFSPYFEFYSNNYLNGEAPGKGNSGITSDNGIWGATLNPASLNIKNKFQFNIQYSLKTSQEWKRFSFSSITLQQYMPFAGSVAFGYKINKNFQTGFIYSNPASLKVSGSGDEIPTPDRYFNFVIHTFTIPIVYSTGIFVVGVNLSYSYLRSYTNEATTITQLNSLFEAVTTTNRFNMQLGFKLNVSKFYSIGGTVTSGSKTNAKLTLQDGSSFQSISKYPWKAGIGFEYLQAEKGIRFSCDFNYVNTSYNTGLKDRYDLNLGIEYQVNERLFLRSGFFTLFDYTGYADRYTQYFLTLGGTLKLKGLDLTASILDSHISPGIIKNTYFQTSLTYGF
jgi:hypothetical protein